MSTATTSAASSSVLPPIIADPAACLRVNNQRLPLDFVACNSSGLFAEADDALRWWTWIPEENSQRGILRQQSPTCAEGGHSCCVDWFIQGPGAGGWGTWDCNGGANQQFEWEPRLGFCNVHSRACVWPLPDGGDGHGKVQLVPLPPRLERARARPRYAS